MPQLEVNASNPGCSDHISLSMSFGGDVKKEPKLLKFLNFLTVRHSFQEVVNAAWRKPAQGWDFFGIFKTSEAGSKTIISR